MDRKKLKKSTRKKLKWAVILISSLTTLIGAFTGNIALMFVTSLMFWIYVVLDKFNPLTKSDDLSKIVVKPKVKKLKKENLENIDDDGIKFYDNSQDSGY